MKSINLTVDELRELDYLLVLAIGTDNRLIDSELTSLPVRKIACQDLDSNRNLLKKIRVAIDCA